MNEDVACMMKDRKVNVARKRYCMCITKDIFAGVIEVTSQKRIPIEIDMY